MSHDTSWDVDNYREEYESEEHWQLRKSFIERWKPNYPEERLICLARVFVNVELMGCRYPPEVMKEIAGLSEEVARSYRQKKKGQLQRTFVSASDAAEDRAKGIKRAGGVVTDALPEKSAKISFVPQGHAPKNPETVELSDSEGEREEIQNEETKKNDTAVKSDVTDVLEYLKEMQMIKCLYLRSFREQMFNTSFGKMVLLIRPWTTKLGNIQASCAACRLVQSGTYNNGCFSLTINNTLVAQATGPTKAEARSIVETMAWNRVKTECISILIKEQWIAQGDARITSDDVTGPKHKQAEFGTPIESSVATKMMKMMGWSGGGLGVEAQGIAEPIKPHLQMVNRAGLGSNASDIHALRRSAQDMMRRYSASLDLLDVDLVFSSEFSKLLDVNLVFSSEFSKVSEALARAAATSDPTHNITRRYSASLDLLDVDLVFSSEFSKEERATLHQIAKRSGLASHSYGKDDDRFLVVKKKLDPFSLVRAVLEKGGTTPKYQVFIPSSLQRR